MFTPCKRTGCPVSALTSALPTTVKRGAVPAGGCVGVSVGGAGVGIGGIGVGVGVAPPPELGLNVPEHVPVCCTPFSVTVHGTLLIGIGVGPGVGVGGTGVGVGGTGVGVGGTEVGVGVGGTGVL